MLSTQQHTHDAQSQLDKKPSSLLTEAVDNDQAWQATGSVFIINFDKVSS